MVLSTEVGIVLEGRNGDSIGLAVCNLCAALLPGSELSQQVHKNWHEQVNGIDQRAGR